MDAHQLTSKHTRRVTRLWRMLFVFVALGLTVATHWPALHLGPRGFSAPDKILHMIAFGSLVLLLAQTRWVSAPWAVGLIVMVWAAADELTQGVPALRRTSSWKDLVSSQTGILVALAWWWALAPIGGMASRTSRQWHMHLYSDLFVRFRGWILSAVGGVLGAVLIGGTTWALLRVAGVESTGDRELLTWMVVAVFTGVVAGSVMSVAAQMQHSRRAATERRPCFECGKSCRDAVFDESGQGNCPACGAVIKRGQWGAPVAPVSPGLWRGVTPAVLAAIVVELAAVLLYGTVLLLSPRVPVAKKLLEAWHGIGPDMRLAVDLAVLAMALAVAVRVYRRHQAAIRDRQHLVCRNCGHDLKGTSIQGGLGVCGECGAPFARFPDD